MIADIVYKNKMYYVLNEQGKEISRNWESTLGELMGFSGTFIVFRRNKMFYTMDDRLKEIARNWESTLGEFRNVIYTYDSRLKEISRRWE